jgi:hypothetical protein
MAASVVAGIVRGVTLAIESPGTGSSKWVIYKEIR